ncbi:glycosyltransferase family 4 protein [Kozakia baliensis]|uniref:Mannosyltransferase n=1 Tax=Kozakia baliensis TaxID=153496 RepID=A0A1D8UWT2_9PROT|nr:glycosyltransferase family 1 protein [Kozakia baliensis]AOX18114.1 mannosyltransferase [Kozakia baliensis]GBR29060.1 glycosyltransferase [Kozakia baliensis NRIC 0488]GEL63462.1 glycosyl transferase [Kozakia baliensis]
MTQSLRTGSSRPEILFDISRLLSRADQAIPTGIDRVELAYAHYLLAHRRDKVIFSALHPIGRYATLPFELSERFIEALLLCWDAENTDASPAKLGRQLQNALLFSRGPHPAGPCKHLLVSHHHLTRPRIIEKVLAKYRASFVTMVHDLIPIDYPEYARPREPKRHELRIQTVTRYAESIVTPSEPVSEAMRQRLGAAGRGSIPVHTIPHGVHRHAASDLPPAEAEEPYFVCIGTIEPRKNHLLLLNLWRQMVEEGKKPPRLIVIGKRGWENENIVDMLDRCPKLNSYVSEHNTLPDAEVVRLLKGSRALLFPSFVEGFGLPLAEALSLGVPALCADIPVLREVGEDVVDYLDALDGPGWKRAIQDFAADGVMRQAQMARLQRWSPVSWEKSVEMAVESMDL